ncbi:NAD(P)H-binding protein [Streptomyces daliensis]
MAVLITCASGSLGRATAHSLASTGLHVVPAAREPKRIPSAGAGKEQPRCVDYDAPEGFAAALRGVTHVLLIAPPADPLGYRRVVPFIEAAVAADVRHLVINSAVQSGHDEEFSLRRIERAAETSGCAWTHIRSQWYMSSLTSGVFAEMVRTGELALPMGAGRTAVVDVRDVADVIARVLTEPTAHAGAVHTVTGPEALDWHTIADLCTRCLGHAVRYRPVREDEYRRGSRAAGIPDSAVDMLLGLFASTRTGHAARVTSTVRRLTGHAPRTLRQCLTETG